MVAQSLPQMFFDRAATRGSQPAQRFKQAGGWQDLSWQALSNRVQEIAKGLLACDLRIGDRVAILAHSRPEWVQCDLGILAAAGITVPIYPSSTAEQTAYILQNAEVTLAFVDTPEQLSKLLEVWPQVPALRHIILMCGSSAGHPQVLTLAQMVTRGAAAQHAETRLAQRLQALTPDHEATYVYTSGTTGPPKGVVQTHGNHLFMVESGAQVNDIRAGDVNLLFLPLAHAFARFEEFLGLYVGLTTAFAESIDALAQNMQEIRPTLVFSVPRVYEKIYGRVLAAGRSGSSLKKAIFQWCIDVGKHASAHQQRGQPLPGLLAWKHKLAHRLVFHKLHHAVGGRLRYFVSGGAPLAQDIAEFFHAAGILILEGYGLTETCPALTVNRCDAYKFGTVGQALPGVDIRLAADGEILARGPNIAKGYYKRPQETAEVFGEDGWFATGDIGELDAAGFLRITDRKKDLLVTSGGKNIAPQNIENLLKTDPYISQAMIYGDRRKYLTAILTLDLEETTRYASEHRLSYRHPEELAALPQIRHLLEQRIARLNERLASYETIKDFIIAPTDFSQESGELTPTLKIKRQVVIQRYQTQLDQLYARD